MNIKYGQRKIVIGSIRLHGCADSIFIHVQLTDGDPRRIFTYLMMNNLRLNLVIIINERIYFKIAGLNFRFLFIEHESNIENGFSTRNHNNSNINSSYYNILLLGETGVGKSTLVNAIANYLTYKSLEEAADGNCKILIPARITLTDRNRKQIPINIGNIQDDNENREIGVAATQNIKTYVFPIEYNNNEMKLRLIDTPGMGDCRGIQQDDKNCENILNYLTQLKELHAICFLLKPDQSRITLPFQHCIKRIFSRLDKSASDMIFLFTNTRGTNYGAGETLPCLEKMINDIQKQPPHVQIPLQDNIFYLDNEAFRYLAGVKHGLVFDEEFKDNCKKSWMRSTQECWRLLFYIIGNGISQPHQLSNTISINEVRKLIYQLAQPLVEVTQLIKDNLYVLGRHQQQLQIKNLSSYDVKKQLYMPIIDLDVAKLTEPITVCASAKCSKIYHVGSLKKWHYKQICHNPCHLTNMAVEMIGDTGLRYCAAMGDTKTCKQCYCDFSTHMHIYYYSTTVKREIVDKTIDINITTTNDDLDAYLRNLKKAIQMKMIQLKTEGDFIIKTSAQFASFLQNNAITPFNDSYKSYIEYLIIRERGLGVDADQLTIKNLEKMLQQYEAYKKSFDDSLNSNKTFGWNLSAFTINSKTILATIDNLYKLTHTGRKIKEIMSAQSISQSNEYAYSEYIHPKVTFPSFSQSKNDNKDNDEEQNKSTSDNTEQQSSEENSSNRSRTPPPPYVEHNPQSDFNLYPNFNQLQYQNYSNQQQLPVNYSNNQKMNINQNPGRHYNNCQQPFGRFHQNYSLQLPLQSLPSCPPQSLPSAPPQSLISCPPRSLRSCPPRSLRSCPPQSLPSCPPQSLPSPQQYPLSYQRNLPQLEVQPDPVNKLQNPNDVAGTSSGNEQQKIEKKHGHRRYPNRNNERCDNADNNNCVQSNRLNKQQNQNDIQKPGGSLEIGQSQNKQKDDRKRYHNRNNQHRAKCSSGNNDNNWTRPKRLYEQQNQNDIATQWNIGKWTNVALNDINRN